MMVCVLRSLCRKRSHSVKSHPDVAVAVNSRTKSPGLDKAAAEQRSDRAAMPCRRKSRRSRTMTSDPEAQK